MRASTYAAVAILLAGCTEARAACVRDADCPAFQRCSDGRCSPLVCDGPDGSRGRDSTEIVGDEVDQNCDGTEVCFVDDDMDGFRSIEPREIASSDADCTDAGEARASLPATDCDDVSASTNPSAAETCNLGDDDCDDAIDEGAMLTFYRDADGDGSGVTEPTATGCTAPAGYADDPDDCNDASAEIHPGAAELCNAIDDDCTNGPDDAFACVTGSVEGCTACGFSGVRSCSDGCAWGACSGYSISSVYDDTVTPFGHACGFDCGDGDWCILGAPGGGCDIVSSGPGLAVPVGRYEVDFYFGDTGTFDFFVYTGGALAGSATYTNTSGFPHVIVPFSVGSDCAPVSLRLFGRGGARIRLYTITIRRSGD
jgi:hypothetical protein